MMVPSGVNWCREKKEAKDDASIDNLELTISFAEQLKQLQKVPYKVPRVVAGG